MLSRFFFAIPLFVNCSSSLEECKQYSEEAQHYCSYLNAPKLNSIEQCTEAGEWETECRHYWTEYKLWTTDTPRDALLQTCADDSNCILDVLDVRNSEDIFEQLILCEQWAGTNQRHCASHAMQRWRYEKRNAEEFTTLLALQNPFAEEIGYWLAMTQVCDRIGQCSGRGDAYNICVDYNVMLQKGKMSCLPPSQHPTKPSQYQ